ncbi:MAG: hypothetical protein IPH72_32815 [Sandaracinaceae bacterium]|nr:hypothetical protein [Sandaracinaceae bacterium]
MLRNEMATETDLMTMGKLHVWPAWSNAASGRVGGGGRRRRALQHALGLPLDQTTELRLDAPRDLARMTVAMWER